MTGFTKILKTMVVVVAMTVLSLPVAARAEVTCTFAGSTVTVRITGSDSTEISRNAGGNIRVDGAQCGNANVDNTDLIQVTSTGGGSSSVTIDQRQGGPFAPGKTAEASPSISEIEFQIDLGSGTSDSLTVITGDAPNTIYIGGTPPTINLNGDDDADVTVTAVELITVSGGPGNDRVLATGGGGTGESVAVPLTLIGAAGNDTLVGGTGNDTLNGGDGADTLNGNTGNDTENGGENADTFDQGASSNGGDTLNGGPASDTLSYASRTNSVIASLDGVANDGELFESDNALEIDVLIGGSNADLLFGDDGVNTLSGGAGNDTLNAQGGADTLNGDAGNDSLSGGDANDTENGGDGDDLFVQDDNPNGADSLVGGLGADLADYSARSDSVVLTLDGSSNDGEEGEADNIGLDVEGLAGGEDADQLTGSVENNILRGNGGADTLRGLDGGDVLAGGSDADTLDGGAGMDTADYSTSSAAVSVDLATLTISGGDATGDTYAAAVDPGTGQTFSTIENVVGSRFEDVLVGNTAANTLIGKAGKDSIKGGGGTDRLEGNTGYDGVSGGDGNDQIGGGEGNDRMDGGSGSDHLSGRAGNDTISGGTGNDVMDGGAGRDKCTGGPGKDKAKSC